jgi:hypothetical protein
MASDVAPELRSRALKKLFTDPHFNVMDGLDTYIDDYGKPDPIPESWYGRMNRIAGDMRPEPEPEAEPGGAVAAVNPDDTSHSQSPEAAPPTTIDHSSSGTNASDAETLPNPPSLADITKPIQAHE